MIFGRLFFLKKESSIGRVIWEPNNLDETHDSLKISFLSSDLFDLRSAIRERFSVFQKKILILVHFSDEINNLRSRK